MIVLAAASVCLATLSLLPLMMLVIIYKRKIIKGK